MRRLSRAIADADAATRTTWLVIAAGLLWWLVLWPLPTISNDDLYFMTRAGLPHGRQTPGSLAGDLWVDVMRRNGRVADIVAEVIFSFGEVATRTVMALLCWGSGFALWRVARLVVDARAWSGPLLAALTTAIPLVASRWEEGLGGHTLYFMAAVVGYCGGLVLFLAGVHPLLARWLGRPVSRRRVWLGAALIVAAAWQHEAITLQLFALVAMMLVLQRWRPLPPGLRPVLLVTAGLGVVRMLAPGLWRRRGLAIETDPTESSMIGSLSKAVAQFGSTQIPVLVALTLAVVFATWTISRDADEADRRFVGRWLAVLVAAVSIWIFVGCLALGGVGRRTLSVPVTSPLARIVLLFAIAAFGIACLALLLWLQRVEDHPGLWLTAVLLVMAFGALVPSFATGAGFGRPVYFADYLFWLVTVCLLVATPRPGRPDDRWPNRIRGAFAVVLLLSALTEGVIARHELSRNHAVWVQIEQQIEDARRGGTKLIVLPRAMPSPRYARDWPKGKLPALDRLHLLHDLPDDVKIEWEQPR